MEEPPTKAQLALIDDADALDAIREELSLRISHIEADLEFSDRDDDWAHRARSALAHHRYSERLTIARLNAVRRSVVKASVRERTDCAPLSLEVLDGWTVDIEAVTTLEEATRAEAEIVARVDALTEDRDDEIGSFVEAERDLVWIMKANRALKRIGALRNILLRRASELRKAERLKEHAALQHRDIGRERLFIESARELLDRDTFLALWEMVDRREAAGREVAA